MPERDTILIALVKEVLGPRNGSHEVLPVQPNYDQDPRSEYITGVLAPINATRPVDDIESDIDEVIEEVSSEEDDESDANVIVPSVFSPALDPKAQPRSLGLSFTVEASEAIPYVEICATWARYQPHAQGWERIPAYYLTGTIRADQSDSWTAGPGVSLQLRSRALANGGWRISVFLVNATEVPAGGRADTTHFIFQPQIRVNCDRGTHLVPVWVAEETTAVQPGSLAAEDASLSLLYRDRAAFARGHLCGAVWEAIDPERPHQTLQSPAEAPFSWTDADIVPSPARERFSPPDVRTEFIPCYPIETPVMEWDDQHGPSPTLDPDILAESWHPDQMRDRLQPLVDAYRSWVSGQSAAIHGLSPAQQIVAREHLNQCEAATNRMQDAIGFLVDDADVRLAFCFANRAIAMQSQWHRPQGISWRPFQLAFILLNIPALADPLRSDRRTCDLLWFPTGGGKTEAYLGLTAFVLALRRRRAISGDYRRGNGAGVGVLSRYTLRLLTIQQFRRALGIITACEFLRVQGLNSPGTPVGWRPQGCAQTANFLWGGVRFAAGLWVGGGVTPNNMHSIGPLPGNNGSYTFYAGALDILQGAARDYNGPNQALRQNIQRSRFLEIEGEPAQVLTCPRCNAILAVPSGDPEAGLEAGEHTLHFVFGGGNGSVPAVPLLQPANIPVTINAVSLTTHSAANFYTLSVTFTVPAGRRLSAREVDDWWNQTIVQVLGQNAILMAARPARPGYFILSYEDRNNNPKPCDFDIYCPDPSCELNQYAWAEQVPLPRNSRAQTPAGVRASSMGVPATDRTAALPSTPEMQWQDVPGWSQRNGVRRIADRIPIPAFTVDDQVYHRCPSLVIATVDKFARLAYEPRASSLVGNVDHYHGRWGYYREGCPPSSGGNLSTSFQPHPAGISQNVTLRVAVTPFSPPDLILQDELHLIEGPLGSLVGLYESALDLLCHRHQNKQIIVPKYVASTATARQAGTQVQALFNRSFAQFPPPAISSDDRFFAIDHEVHPLDSVRSGRLYIAVCAPGKGALTPIVRIWSSLLQSSYERWLVNQTLEVDRFYTLVGYFNAIRELAGAVSLYRQDIPERIARRAPVNGRTLTPDRQMELSGRSNSLTLPSLLDRLKQRAPDAQDAVFATSMFGTGVDVDRLGLMVVNGQPKTTASYIQATGRVGRSGGGLIVTFLRASRPRDLDHYEFFTGYHRALYRHVEPVTVAPFSPRARERGLGPLAVILLRHSPSLYGRQVNQDWRVQQRLSGAYFSHAQRMGTHRFDSEVTVIADLLEARARQQPDGRIPPQGAVAQEVGSDLDRWSHIARLHPGTDNFVYSESAWVRTPRRHVVLGDAHHRAQGLDEAFRNAPQSLRDVEETTGFKI